MATNALNPSVVQTLLDDVFSQEWNFKDSPNYATVETPAIFRQRASDKALEKEEVLVPGGYWAKTNEGQNLPKSETRVQDRVIYEHVKFAKGEIISKEFFDDDQHNVVADLISRLAMNGRRTQNQQGFSVYRNAFDPAFAGGDGQPLISSVHPTSGLPADNALTDKLTPDSLNDALIKHINMLSKDGVKMGHRPDVLMVAPFNFKRACEIVDSELLADTANNNSNVYSSKYGLYVYQAPFLSAVDGGLDDSWFLMSSRYHSVTRYIRDPLHTYFKDYTLSDNETYRYNASYRESYGFTNYAGIVGSDGTTGVYN